MQVRWLFFLAVFAVLLVSAICLLPGEPTSQAAADRFWVLKTHGEARYDAVVMGDSRTYRGVVPGELERRLPGLSVVNLGYSSAGIDGAMLDLVQRRLEPSPTGEAVVLVGVTPFFCTEEAGRNEHLHQELARSRVQQFNFVHVGPVRAWFDPVRPTRVWGVLRGREEGYFQEFEDNGWVASRSLPEDEDAALDSYRMMFGRHRFSWARVGQLAERIRAWRAQGIRVMAFRPPVTEAMYELEEQLSGFPEEQVRDTLLAAGAEWLHLPHTGFHSYDGSHLREDAAREWSRLLADSVARHLEVP